MPLPWWFISALLMWFSAPDGTHIWPGRVVQGRMGVQNSRLHLQPLSD